LSGINPASVSVRL